MQEPKLRISVGIIAILIQIGGSFPARAEPLPGPCAPVLTDVEKAAYYIKRAVDFRGTSPQFIKESKQFIKTQRENFRNLVTRANTTLIEMDQPLKRMIEAMMLETNAYAFGGPGGAKSALTDLLLQTPQEALNGKIAKDYFGIQFNPQLGDYPFRGYLDKAGKVQSEGTMLHSKYAKLDEVDKGTGNSLAALLDLLAERKAFHGSTIIDARIRSAIATSNMTTYEFLEAFKMQGMESTGRALLDRLPFKIYVHNYPTNESLISGAIGLAAERSAAKAEGELSAYFSVGKDKAEAALIPVDFSWFGQIAKRLIRSGRDTDKVFADVINDMKAKVKDKRLSSALAMADDPSLDKFGYNPTTIFSMRNVMNYSKDVVGASLLYDLLVLPESVLPTDTLIALLEKGIELTPESAWRLQDVLLTTTSAAPKLVEVNSKLTLEYGDELRKLIEASGEKREKELLTDLKQESEFFIGSFTDVYGKYKDANVAVSDITSDYLDILGGGKTTAAKIRNIEEWLMRNGGH